MSQPQQTAASVATTKTATNYKYISGHDPSVLKAHAWRTAENSAAYLLPHLRADMHLLDVGCGPGTITLDLAARLPQGRVVGIDPSATAVSQARLTAADRGLTNVEFRVGDVMNLAAAAENEGEQQGFADASFDVVHVHQVLQHLPDPGLALREMSRVLKPGSGMLAVREADIGAMAWWPRVEGLEEWQRLWQKVARSSGCNPDIGRELVSHALGAGFAREDIAATVSTWLFSDVAEREWWSSTWAGRMYNSDFPKQVVERNFGTEADMERLAQGFKEWNDAEDGWFVLIHSELICRKRK